MTTLSFHQKKTPAKTPAWTCAIQEDTYHQSASTGIVISSSMLREFRLCPAHYHNIITGKEFPRKSLSFRFGRAAHKLLLEGESALSNSFVVAGPLNAKTGRPYCSSSRIYRRWLDAVGLSGEAVLTPGESDALARMRDSAKNHAEAASLLASGWARLCGCATLAGLPCQARFDLLRPDGVLVDLRITSDITRFETDARSRGYLHQFAFQRAVAAAAGAGDLDVVAIVIEKRSPFRVGVWRFAPHVLAPYVAQNLTALQNLARCREEDRWPTGYEGSRAFPPAGLPPLWLN